ncbi:MAG: hypothetical protein N2662_10100 [Bacteroidales bacterium]|nr:hypothetical protein [Bacteroidales bacterium]
MSNSAFFFFILFFISCFPHVDAQQGENRHYSLSLLPSYAYFGSIDEIHSPYRYSGKNFSVLVEGKVCQSTKFQSLSLSFESINRRPNNLPIKESILLESYDNNRGSYLWATTGTFLRKQTYVVQQNFTSNYRIPLSYIGGDYFLGYFQQLIAVNCPNLPMLELFSLSAGVSSSFKLPIAKHIQYQIYFQWLLFSLDARNSYASVDGYLNENEDLNFYIDYLKKHVKANSFWFHNYCAVSQTITYEINMNWAFIGGYHFAYRKMSYPRTLKSMSYNFYLGFQYAW